MEFYSHPSKPLIEHLHEVYKEMKGLHEARKGAINLPVDERFLKIVAFSHDFGKYTSYFQRYITNGIRDKNGLHYHSELGGFFAAWWLQKEGYGPAHILAGYLAVRNHHGYLRNNYNYDGWQFEKWFSDLRSKSHAISRELGVDIGEFLTYDLEKIKKALLRAERCIKKKKNLKAYFLTLYTYSLLLEADRRSAGEIEEPGRLYIPNDVVDKYRETKFGSPKREIDRLRDRLYREVIRKVEDMREIPPILTITAPTGLGKTLLNLSVAFKVREKKARRIGFLPRVVYALPFTAIIEQTYTVLDDVLLKTLGNEYAERRENYLIKHHHLSEVTYRKGENGEEVSLNEALFWVEGWESEIVLTTFVQLLEGLIGVKASYLRRFHNLAGAIVILDEVQGIRREHWESVEKAIEGLSEYMGTTFILSTATKPAIIVGDELVGDPKSYILNRTRLLYKPRISRPEEICEYVLKGLEKGTSSYLVVLNTIRSSVRVFNLVKEKAEDMGYKVFYLSSNVVPAHRMKRIHEIRKSMEEGRRVLLVSTQVVEAGVDLDFEGVMRDLGPLDSVVQVAGRCNRNAVKDMGEVIVFHEKENGRSLGSIIYGATHLHQSQAIFQKNPQIEEMDFPKITEEYFRLIKEKGGGDRTPCEGMLTLNFEKVGRFKVIENLPDYLDVFVQVDEEAVKVWNEFIRTVLEEKDFRQRYMNYVKLRRRFRSYIISVPEKYTEGLPDKRGIKYIPYESLTAYYDPQTGFLREGEGFEVW